MFCEHENIFQSNSVVEKGEARIETTTNEKIFAYRWFRYAHRNKRSELLNHRDYILALIANPATTLLNAFDSFTLSAPKIRVSIPVNSGILDEPPVFTTASMEPGSSPDLAIVSSRTFSTLIRSEERRVGKECR